MDYRKVNELIMYIWNAGKVYGLKELYDVFWRKFCDEHLQGLVDDEILWVRNKWNKSGRWYSSSYELHYKYRNAIQCMAKNIANWYVSEEIIDITFDADKDVYIRINNDVYNYSPENWMLKNENRVYSYWERQKIKNRHKTEALWKEIRIRNKFDDDLQEKFISVIWDIRNEQRKRDGERLDEIRSWFSK